MVNPLDLMQQPRRVKLPVCTALLATMSEKFRAWIEHWPVNAAKELVVQCCDEAEEAVYQRLVAFIHSIGGEVPEGFEAQVQLLLLAREHAVEVAVLACVQQLQQQVPTMSATPCLTLLSVLETGTSGHDQLQAKADKLAAAACDRLCKLLVAGTSMAESGEQQQLLQYLGPMQVMLNSERRRKLFARIPFGLLRDCIFADDSVDADTETTVLAAFAYWAERNIKATDPGARERIATICCRIRFPAIPVSVLWNYHMRHEFMRIFDPDKALLFRAVAEPSVAAAWQELLATGGAADTLVANCERWWTPRPHLLARHSKAADFELQVKYALQLCASQSLAVKQGTKSFLPSAGCGSGKRTVKNTSQHGGQPITWDGFWAEDSRFMHNGAARVRLELRMRRS
ncbi:expressed protein [Chlorella variabilis]|uniref:Expressed protein n=1 Tax=Chlorella variabilis TaxID=554065 RepID=E1ZA04_CHLVA|nr:expressed protein [Chlorella variabilis]EFN57869.1 expressed protein [Chlorella variabilis]|eukprot:XP_005849971.1 expressed protein [Chlorella variabilis]